jgi:hypothetical protein
MIHALSGRGRFNVWGQVDVLDTEHDNPPASTRHMSSATGRLSQRAAWLAVRELRCICLMYNQCKCCSRGQTSPATVFPSVLR